METRRSRILIAMGAMGALTGLALSACSNAEPHLGELARPAVVGDAAPTATPGRERSGRPDRSLPDQPTATILPATPDPKPTRTSTRTPKPKPPPDEPGEPEPPDRPPSEEPPDSEESDPPPHDDPLAEMAAEVVDLTNAERTAHGCEPLHTDDRLRKAAQGHTDDMAEQNYLSHVSPRGDGPGERAAAAGYPNWSGENIARGYPSAESVVDVWMDSEGHRKNILNCESKAIGVGIAEGQQGLYWTQLFGFE